MHIREMFLFRASARLSGFAISVFLSAAVGLIVIPVVISRGGADAWLAVAVGQSIGGLASILVAFGWGVTGPAMIASRPLDSRRIYLESFRIRLLLLVPGACIAVIVALLVAPKDSAVTLVAALGACLAGLSGGWLFVGEGKPSSLLSYDTLPRLGGTVIGLTTLIAGLPVLVFVACAFLGQLASVIVTVWVVKKRPAAAVGSYNTGLKFWTTLYSQRHGMSTALVASTYQLLPLIIVTAVAPLAAAQYALADRLLKLSLAGVVPISQTLQGWVPSGGALMLARRARSATILAGSFGVVGGLALMFLAPSVSRILSQGSITVSVELAIPLGIAFGASIISQTTGLACLLPLGRSVHVAISALLGAVVGVILLFTGTFAFAAQGAAWAVAISEMLVLSYQLIVLSAAIHRRSLR